MLTDTPDQPSDSGKTAGLEAVECETNFAEDLLGGGVAGAVGA
jgi:hypothetical protein